MNHADLPMRRYYAILAALLCIAVFAVHLIWFAPINPNLVTSLWHPFELPSAETIYLYLILHGFILLPIIALSFDKRVAYYTKWKYLLPAVFIVGMVFIIWDFIFTKVGVWGFSDDYTMIYRFLHLPIEEWLFFLSAPFACVFIYECLRYYFPKDTFRNWDRLITTVLVFLFTVLGLYFWGNLYTSVTCLCTAILLLVHFLSVPNTYRTFFYKVQLVCYIPFTLINGVLTGSITISPIVQYNPLEMIDQRIITIPVEDFIYCFMLILSVVTVYEYFRERDRIN